jgi:hypothetical protein
MRKTIDYASVAATGMPGRSLSGVVRLSTFLCAVVATSIALLGLVLAVSVFGGGFGIEGFLIVLLPQVAAFGLSVLAILLGAVGLFIHGPKQQIWLSMCSAAGLILIQILQWRWLVEIPTSMCCVAVLILGEIVGWYWLSERRGNG